MFDRQLILLVDDDSEIAAAAGLRLRAAGYRIVVARDGCEGVAAALKYQPALILLDVRMPKMNGFGAIAELKASSDTFKIPIIMLSASVCDQKAALDAGAKFFLRKPYQGDMLLKMVNGIIHSADRPESGSDLPLPAANIVPAETSSC